MKSYSIYYSSTEDYETRHMTIEATCEEDAIDAAWDWDYYFGSLISITCDEEEL